MSQAALFTNEQCPPPPRPEWRSEEVLRSAAKALLAKLDASSDEAEHDIVEAIRYEDDGYRIGRALEDAGWWDMDAEKVDALDMAGYHKDEAHEALVVAWVKAWGIVPKIGVGASVRFKRSGATCEGVVHGVDTERAQYVVRGEALGRSAAIVNYEDAEVICE